MDKIITYLNEKYSPVSLILYGSYADGTNDRESDFDVLVVIEDGKQLHDTSVVCDVRLDAFIYPKAAFDDDFDYREIIQIHGGTLIRDSGGFGKDLLERVRQQKCADDIAPNTPEEKQADIDWCKKTLQRAKRGDTEGNYRRYWLLTDSLEIWCGLIGRSYPGPKKELRFMEEKYPEAFKKYSAALEKADIEALEDWVNYLASLI